MMMMTTMTNVAATAVSVIGAMRSLGEDAAEP
jgi:hypothetical protein